MTTHTISPNYEGFWNTETMCGIEYRPLIFISYIIFYKLHTVENPCLKCLKLLNEMERSVVND